MQITKFSLNTSYCYLVLGQGKLFRFFLYPIHKISKVKCTSHFLTGHKQKPNRIKHKPNPKNFYIFGLTSDPVQSADQGLHCLS